MKPKKGRWKCHICYRNFNNKLLHDFHLTNHSKMRFKCPEPRCGYTFMFISFLKSHVNSSPSHKKFCQYDKRACSIPSEGSMIYSRPTDNWVNAGLYFGKQEFHSGCLGKYVNNGEHRLTDALIQNWSGNTNYELPVKGLMPVSRSVDNSNSCNTGEHFTIPLNHCTLPAKHSNKLPKYHKFPTVLDQLHAGGQKVPFSPPTATSVQRRSYN